MMVNIGKLDEKIKIYKEQMMLSELNESQPEKVLHKELWAQIEPRTGSLLSGRPAETFLSKTTHVLHVRAEAVKDISYDMWIEWADYLGITHKLYIDYILPPVRDKQLTTIYAHEEL